MSNHLCVQTSPQIHWQYFLYDSQQKFIWTNTSCSVMSRDERANGVLMACSVLVSLLVSVSVNVTLDFPLFGIQPGSPQGSFILSESEGESDFFSFDLCRCSMWTINWNPHEPIWKLCCFRFLHNVNKPLPSVRRAVRLCAPRAQALHLYTHLCPASPSLKYINKYIN